MRFRILLIEDEDLTDLPRRIQAIGGDEFEVTALPPPPNLDLRAVLDVDADLYLVDYELDTSQPGRDLAPYRGVTLAARLRELRPEFAITLLTRSDLPSWMATQRTAKVGAMFDDVLYKDTDLRNNASGVQARLRSLANGYRTFRASDDRSVVALLALLKTDHTGRDNALEALPPENDWKGFEASHWIRSVLLRYPGVLYNRVHASTALGISLEDFDHVMVRESLQSARYHGPFSEEREHWWRHALFDIANRMCQEHGIELGVREGFRRAVKQEFQIDLDPSRDIETDATPADTVCHFLGLPVRIETSLPYHPDARPPIMENARVSFRAIRERNDVEDMHFDAATRNRLDVIRAIGQ